MFGAHALATSIRCFDLDCVLSDGDFDFLVLSLEAFELHYLHVDNHCWSVHSPQVKSFLELTPEEFDQSHFELTVKNSFLFDWSMLPMIEILAELSAEKSHKGLHWSLLLLQRLFVLNLADGWPKILTSWSFLNIQSIVDIGKLFLFFVLSKSIVALL